MPAKVRQVLSGECIESLQQVFSAAGSLTPEELLEALAAKKPIISDRDGAAYGLENYTAAVKKRLLSGGRDLKAITMTDLKAWTNEYVNERREWRRRQTGEAIDYVPLGEWVASCGTAPAADGARGPVQLRWMGLDPVSPNQQLMLTVLSVMAVAAVIPVTYFSRTYEERHLSEMRTGMEGVMASVRAVHDTVAAGTHAVYGSVALPAAVEYPVPLPRGVDESLISVQIFNAVDLTDHSLVRWQTELELLLDNVNFLLTTTDATTTFQLASLRGLAAKWFLAWMYVDAGALPSVIDRSGPSVSATGHAIPVVVCPGTADPLCPGYVVNQTLRAGAWTVFNHSAPEPYGFGCVTLRSSSPAVVCLFRSMDTALTRYLTTLQRGVEVARQRAKLDGLVQCDIAVQLNYFNATSQPFVSMNTGRPVPPGDFSSDAFGDGSFTQGSVSGIRATVPTNYDRVTARVWCAISTRVDNVLAQLLTIRGSLESTTAYVIGTETELVTLPLVIDRKPLEVPASFATLGLRRLPGSVASLPDGDGHLVVIPIPTVEYSFAVMTVFPSSTGAVLSAQGSLRSSILSVLPTLSYVQFHGRETETTKPALASNRPQSEGAQSALAARPGSARNLMPSDKHRRLPPGGSTRLAVYTESLDALIIAEAVVRPSTDRFPDLYAGMTGLAAGVTIACVLLLALTVGQVLSYVLSHIEEEYKTFKTEVDQEKSQFADLLRDNVPAYAIDRIHNGEKLFIDTFYNLTFIFSDVKKFTEATKSMAVNDLVRMVGFCFLLQDTVAEYYGVTKVKSIGDSYFGLTGLEEASQDKSREKSAQNLLSKSLMDDAPNAEYAADDKRANSTASPSPAPLNETDDTRDGGAALAIAGHEDHPVHRAAAFACVVQLLMNNKRFIAFPEKLPWFAAATGERNDPLTLPQLRVGFHTARITAGIVDPGRAAQFDCYGEAISLSRVVEGSCPVGQVQASMASRDVLIKIDTTGNFVFGPPVQSMPKWGSAVTVFPILATMLRPPDAIVDKLCLTPITKRRRFDDTGLMIEELQSLGGAFRGVQDGASSLGSSMRDTQSAA